MIPADVRKTFGLNSGNTVKLELGILENIIKVPIYGSGRTVRVVERTISPVFRFDQSKKGDYVYSVTTFPVKLDPKGRVIIPVGIRKMLGMDVGDVVNQYLSISDRSMKLEKNGCGGVKASTKACGAFRPSSNLGRGPKTNRRQRRWAVLR